VLSVNHPYGDKPNERANKNILPMVMIVCCAADGNAGGGEEAGEEEEEVEGGGRSATSEGAKLAGEVEKDKTPGDKGERGVARRKTLSTFDNCGQISFARKIGRVKSTIWDLAVRPASEDEVRPRSTDTKFNHIG